MDVMYLISVERTVLEQFPIRLKSALKDAGMTQKDLAETAQVFDGNISRYVNGKRYPSAITLARIASVLNVSTDYLLGLE